MGETTPTTTTTELLVALRNPENRVVWSLLDERYRGFVESISLQRGVRGEDAADIAQQTMMDVFTGFQAGAYDRSKGRLRTWILTIARRRIIDVLRAQYRSKEGKETLDSSVESPIDEGDELAKAWAQAEERAVLQEALAVLRRESKASESNLKAFELVQLRGMPEAAAAAECGLSVEQVYVAKHRLTKRLREIVAQVQEAYNADEWKAD
jgi:RNA polymerase sigma-70 factor (ECF subfamily)